MNWMGGLQGALAGYMLGDELGNGVEAWLNKRRQAKQMRDRLGDNGSLDYQPQRIGFEGMEQYRADGVMPESNDVPLSFGYSIQGNRPKFSLTR